MRRSDGQGIDWDDVKRRLARSNQILQDALTPDAEKVDAIFRERAAAFARRSEVKTKQAELRVLVVGLGNESYGFPLVDVAEIVPFAGCTPVPGGPRQLLGVMNFHGDIRSVMDLGRSLGVTADSANADAGYVLLVRSGGLAAGLRVARIERIRSIVAADIRAVSQAESEPGLQFLQGLGPDRLRLLNTRAILSENLFPR